MASNKPLPKTQLELSNDSINPLLSRDKNPLPNPKRREYQRTVKDDDVKNYSTGLRDIDEAIFYYFNNVIKPSVIQNGKKIEVPIVYGSPERWASVQKDGFYRDRNGKIQTPLIMIKRDLVEKNRTLSNKMDANNPNNFYIFEKKYSTKNNYDRFSTLTNREPIKEYQAVVVPDFVDITYSCIIFSEYVEQMNKLVESINYASDSYWGDPQKYKFRAMIDSFTTTTEIAQGQDRTVKTTFTLKLLGHIISDAINTQLQGSRKFFSKSSVSFGFETVTDLQNIDATTRNISKTNAGFSRFYDKAGETLNLINIAESMTAEQKAYVSLQKIYSSRSSPVTVNTGTSTLTWLGITLAPIPSGFPALTKQNFQVFINGLIVENDAIDSIEEVSGNMVVIFNNTLNFSIEASDEYTIIGKFN